MEDNLLKEILKQGHAGLSWPEDFRLGLVDGYVNLLTLQDPQVLKNILENGLCLPKSVYKNNTPANYILNKEMLESDFESLTQVFSNYIFNYMYSKMRSNLNTHIRLKNRTGAMSKSMFWGWATDTEVFDFNLDIENGTNMDANENKDYYKTYFWLKIPLERVLLSSHTKWESYRNILIANTLEHIFKFNSNETRLKHLINKIGNDHTELLDNVFIYDIKQDLVQGVFSEINQEYIIAYYEPNEGIYWEPKYRKL